MSSVFSSEQPPWLSHLNHVLSLEDLTVDEGLTHLQKVERYVSSPIPLQRLVHLRLFASTAKEHGLDVTRTVLLPLIGLLTMDDKVVVRQELPTQIILISQHFVAASSSIASGELSSASPQDNDEGYSLFLESLLPCIARLLHDQREEVRQAASEALVEAAQLVRPADIGRHVLALVLRLAHDDENDSLRMTAAWLLNELSPRLGPELSHQFLLPECVSLAEDPDPRVRRHMAWNLLHIFTILRGPKRLLGAFVGLCEDDNYRVRKACTETISDLCAVLPQDLRASVMLKAFTQLLHDSSNSVRTAAKVHLGMFVATLERAQVTAELAQSFASLSEELDLRQHCAFQFPAVCFTLGEGRWGELRDCFSSLAGSGQQEVRRTLSCSLHVVAKVLGAELTESELLPVFESFIHDADPSVSVGVTNHLAEFLAVVTPSWRESYLPLAEEQLVKATKMDWRARQTLAVQLQGLAGLVTADLCHELLVPLSNTLLADSVAHVRQAAVQTVPAFFSVLSANPGLLWRYADSLQAFARASAFQKRQTFVHIFFAVLTSAEESFESLPDGGAASLLLLFTGLASDPVPGVRITLSKCVYQLPSSVLQAYPSIQEARAFLDGDDAVLKSCPPPPPSIAQTSNS
eukprot:CAMPEP_0171716238 /NCGR_PEP_ID=MMETSP0991-20121206/19343_1 /TAXON_ID=483369 /ORGANISM="non described non described, Strain CCMP2098" /LENGTH=633 /DNA_ID=CAMNT_0012307275 /DNA_START=189 /DNA_END=2090 /DNA_ORIENTATION=+